MSIAYEQRSEAVIELTGGDLNRLYASRRNRDMYRRLRYLNSQDAQEETHFCIFDDGKLIAVASVQDNPDDSHQLWFKQVSVDERHQGRGYATLVTRAAFVHASQAGKTLLPSSFTRQGQRLKAVFDRFNREFPDTDPGVPHRDFC